MIAILRSYLALLLAAVWALPTLLIGVPVLAVLLCGWAVVIALLPTADNTADVGNIQPPTGGDPATADADATLAQRLSRRICAISSRPHWDKERN